MYKYLGIAKKLKKMLSYEAQAGLGTFIKKNSAVEKTTMKNILV
jgi:hypothetical protein